MNLTKHNIIQWGGEYLLSHGYLLKSTKPENVQIRPWSYVIRYDTSDGWIYLKQTPQLIALEAKITKILHDQFHAFVPEIIASNTNLNCFLMKDGPLYKCPAKCHFSLKPATPNHCLSGQARIRA